MIDHRLCKYIQTIAQYRSFSRAAQALYVSQPSLSRLVKKVETELGTPLFDRDTSPIELTPAGETYLEYIRRFQDLEREMKSNPVFRPENTSNCLTIGTLPLLGLYALPRLVPVFAERFPTADQKIVEYSSPDIIQKLEARDVDLILTNLKPTQEIFTYRKLLRDPILLAARYDEKMQQRFPDQCNNLDAPVPIELSELQNETLIILRSWQNMRTAAEIVCKHYSFSPRKVLEAPSLPTALSLAGGGFGITFICPSYVHNIQPQAPMIYFSLDEVSSTTDILAVFRKDNKNRLIQEFCNCATEKLADP